MKRTKRAKRTERKKRTPLHGGLAEIFRSGKAPGGPSSRVQR